ncbi:MULTISPECIES: hypothetical protein [Niastella]|uniref:PEGA domain-containing protein n=1 Tax=Niastella soli TaxID=2821487 RepID=A0ABS3YPW6_9BACT|nr:hypothetical protein [Niastella soli]MBO9199927.1 hypothetical protein [Niastella soli]
MKQIFTFIAVLFSISTFAAPGPKTSKISISNSNRTETQVRIDGVTYNLNNTFVMDNIRSGNHTISIIQLEKFGFRKIQKTIYNSTMSVAPGQMVNIDINRNGQVVVKTASNVNSPFDRNDRNDHYNDNKGYNDHDNRNNNNNYGRH